VNTRRVTALLCIGVWLFAFGERKITGTVLDSTTSEPLIGASVIIEGTPIHARTDKRGKFYMRWVPVGIYTLTAVCGGYDSASVVVEVRSDRTTTCNVLMRPEIRFGKITGTVLNSTTNEPLIGANVIIRKTEYSAATDETGGFIINYVLRPGTYKLTAFYLGYEESSAVVTIKTKQITTCDFRLQPSPIITR